MRRACCVGGSKSLVTGDGERREVKSERFLFCLVLFKGESKQEGIFDNLVKKVQI